MRITTEQADQIQVLLGNDAHMQRGLKLAQHKVQHAQGVLENGAGPCIAGPQRKGCGPKWYGVSVVGHRSWPQDLIDSIKQWPEDVRPIATNSMIWLACTPLELQLSYRSFLSGQLANNILQRVPISRPSVLRKGDRSTAPPYNAQAPGKRWFTNDGSTAFAIVDLTRLVENT